MALFSLEAGDNLRIAVWQMEEDWEAMCRAVDDPAVVEEAVSRFASPSRRMEWLAARALLGRMGVGKQTIAYLPSGRPFLESGDWQISISHTKGYVAVILGRMRVAVDIEQYGRRVHRVRERFVRADEAVLPYGGEDTWSLLLHWSAKETVYKRLDEPGIDFLQHLRVLPFVPDCKGELRVRVLDCPEPREFAVRYVLHPRFVLTWQWDRLSPGITLPPSGAACPAF